VVFVAEDLGAWLTGVLADAGRRKLVELVLGTEPDRALRQAATVAIELAAAELRPEAGERAEELARVIDQVFSTSMPALSDTAPSTLLETLQTGVTGQLAVLDDAGLTGTGQSSARLLEIPADVLAQVLTAHLISQIVSRGSRGGPLEPLANQLSHDRTYLQSLQVAARVGQLDARVAAVLEGVGQSAAISAAARPPMQLPPQTAVFTGRHGELAELAELLDPSRTSSAVVVSAVAGLPGVGKTTLAVQAAHDALKRGWFAGGALFVNLHGYDDLPVQPSQALEGLLRALGVAAENIPLDSDHRATLYRSALAQLSDPVLIIADNASSESQVRPLLPGAGPHKLLVTSRHTLADLEARHIDVTVLDDETGAEMLAAALRTARPTDGRIAGDPATARQLVGYCGGLPLALQIVAALLKSDPALSLAELRDELAIESERLEQLRYDDGGGLAAPSVAAAFDLSYRRLEPVQSQVFRLLSVNPGPDVATAAVAKLASLPVSRARRTLAGLARAHLIEIAALQPQARWRMHDLLRLYAQKLADKKSVADFREQALDRLFKYYLDTADLADDFLQGTPPGTEQAPFKGRGEALQWLDAERENLVDTARMAAATDRDHVACLLPIVLVRYFSWRRRFDDWLDTTRIGLEASRRIGDKVREGVALNNLGAVLRELRRINEAISACEESVAIHRELGDKRGESNALNNLGAALYEARRFEEAIIAPQSDLAICREIGDRQGEADALNSLGLAMAEIRRHAEAISAHEQAAAIYRETRDRHGEASAMNNLGVALNTTWTHRPRAIATLREAITIFRETGDRHGEGTALNNLGVALRDAFLPIGEAIMAHEGAVDIFRELDDNHSKATALNNLGLALAKNGDLRKAVSAHYAALTIFRQEGDLRAEASALNGLGRSMREQQRFTEATRAHQRAVDLFRRTGVHFGEADALSNLGLGLIGLRRFDQALSAFESAIAIYEEIGDWHGEWQSRNYLEQVQIARQAF
jgi:tetratricopeptide (TPR) repeat protein